MAVRAESKHSIIRFVEKLAKSPKLLRNMRLGLAEAGEGKFVSAEEVLRTARSVADSRASDRSPVGVAEGAYQNEHRVELKKGIA